ncbi:cytosolic endo-beta-N-acetylglucosaminidase isoform X2 [Daktulosphaira vitifoliae]|uniref:cytosolic endo-beta-N-acetylglucosaminidase isoform X2 n=1 Tax=Daktulosphaira vitifoliae TaxID=58002 RepID=UPI0021AB0A33|nr:cytosolic endo-beta-N-acetylglucosaminidase isoform X2 [Daktulosphaira vitifoliae]
MTVRVEMIGWTNAAHKHGVKSLGTLITEWNDGYELWRKVFNNLDKRDILIDKLVQICKYYNFDGYLINIENNLSLENIENMIETVSLLRTKLKATIAHSEVIWYDSVSMVNGKLAWQNQLNIHNKLAFQACDGIFLNYNWKEEDLIKSIESAGSRILDIYVGVDVFGRNCLGGLDCYKSLELIRQYDLSVAIFAPGWTYETLSDKKLLIENENTFWRTLYPYMYIHIPSTLPLCTYFCRGYGIKKMEKGQLSSVNSWFNLSKMNFQTSVPLCLSNNKPSCISYDENDAITGGGCLKLNGHRESSTYYRILVCHYEIKSKLCFEIAVKAMKPYDTHKIFMIAIDPYGMPYKMEFGVQGDDNLFFNNCDDYSCIVPNTKLYKLTVQDGWLVHNLSCQMEGIIVEIAIETEEPLLVGKLFLNDETSDCTI